MDGLVMRCKWTQLMARGRFDMFVATSLASNRFIYASMFWLYLTSYIVTSLSLQALYCVPDPDPGSQAWVLLERSLDLSVTAFSTHSFPRIPRMRSASVDRSPPPSVPIRSHCSLLGTPNRRLTYALLDSQNRTESAVST